MANVDFSRYKRLVQFFWDPEPANDATSRNSVWCLGKEYRVLEPDQSIRDSNAIQESSPRRADQSGLHATPPDNRTGSVDTTLAYDDSRGEEDRGWPKPFLDDFEARIWLTYRSNFPVILKSQDPKALSAMSLSVRLRSQLVDQSGFTSDTGWGCMIRSGQSLLANSFLMLRLGRDWRRGLSPNDERKIISMFADDPKAPYSIHKFVQHGANACGKHPGEWFGPSATSRCIQALTNDYEPSGLKVYITGDGSDVYEESFFQVAKSSGIFKPTLILVGTRLGLDKITPVYWEALKASLQMPQSIGIAGGRPSSSHYFVGVQGEYFFYLDPHHTRNALQFPSDPNTYNQEEVDSCHTRRLRRIHVKEMDPSMLIAFLMRSEDDWKDWKRAVVEVQGKAVIHVVDRDQSLHGSKSERDGAIDEVESFDDTDDDTILSD